MPRRPRAIPRAPSRARASVVAAVDPDVMAATVGVPEPAVGQHPPAAEAVLADRDLDVPRRTRTPLRPFAIVSDDFVD